MKIALKDHMLRYQGTIELTPPLSKEEVVFLNQWQAKLREIYDLSLQYKSEGIKPEEAYSKIDSFLGITLTPSQRWTICFWCYSPMIHWSENGIEINGTHQKGQLRESLLAYQYFFFGNNPVLKNACYKELSFLKEHTFNGVIDSYELNDVSQWLYIVKDNKIGSIEDCHIDDYSNNPESYNITEKEDKCIDKLEKYFPPLYRYGMIVKSVYENVKEEKIVKKHKI